MDNGESDRRTSNTVLTESNEHLRQAVVSQRATSQPANARLARRKAASTYHKANADALQHLTEYHLAYIQARRLKTFKYNLPYPAQFPPAEVLLSDSLSGEPQL
ncbi:hypothetical protein K525DRAFT_273206 [Schizophyllum commune Loenen D]|nr:hypothetical protein K525DRAFT_273206 [Schizophyllum commune Loenen D]